MNIRLLFNVRMLLIFLTCTVLEITSLRSFSTSITSFVLISGVVHLLLHIRSEGRVLCENLFFGHLEGLEEEVGLGLSNLIVAILGKILTGLELKVLLILNLFLVNVVLK